MKLNVLKDNQSLFEVDLGAEVAGDLESEVAFFIGRSEDCHVVLSDPQVSREHAQIIHKQGNWRLVRTAEFNNVLVNGSACMEKDLHTGDMVMIGPYVLSVFIPPVQREQMGTTTTVEAEAKTEEPMTETAFVSEEPAIAEQELEPAESQSSDSPEAFSVGEEQDVTEDSFVRDEDRPKEAEEGSFEEDATEDNFAEDGAIANNEDELDGSFEMDAEDDGRTKVLQTFAKFQLEISGEYAPYDKYVLADEETYIGRDPQKCQILLKDPEVSGVHALITKNNIICTLKDLQSGNGTMLNGARINQAELTNHDEFIIGSTTFTVKVISELLTEEEDRLMPVEENQVIEVEEVVEVGANFHEEGEVIATEGEGFGEQLPAPPKSLVGKFKVAWNDPTKRKKIIYGLVGVVVLWVVFGDNPSPPPKEKGKEDAVSKEAEAKVTEKVAGKPKVILSPEEEEFVASHYELAKKLIETGKYSEALFELDAVRSKDPEYKNTVLLMQAAKSGLAQMEEVARKQREETERKIRAQKIKELLVKAQEATANRNVAVAEAIFAQILEMDPENFDVPSLKNELDAWKKEQERIALEKAQKEADRKRKVNELKPGEKYFLKKEWHNAISKLEDFLRIDDMDEDLVQKATEMLNTSRGNLKAETSPRLGKARSLKEGQDLKGAYEQYSEVLQIDPANEEALNEMNEIREVLHVRAQKIYRDAIISESLSLFNEAKEKLQEVKQISPTDSEYYKKADDKLKEYLE